MVKIGAAAVGVALLGIATTQAQTVSSLTQAGPISASDQFYVVQNGQPRRISASDLLPFAGPYTEGGVMFGNAAGKIAQDTAAFFWTDSTKLLTVVGNETFHGDPLTRFTLIGNNSNPQKVATNTYGLLRDPDFDQIQFACGATAVGTSTPASTGSDKVCIYSGMVMGPLTRNGFSINTLLEVQSGWSASITGGAWNYELDINNFDANFGATQGVAGLAPPFTYGLNITGIGSGYPNLFINTSAISIGSLGARAWYRGISFGDSALSDPIVYCAVCDYSYAANTVEIDAGSTSRTGAIVNVLSGHFDAGLNLKNAVFGSASLILPTGLPGQIVWVNGSGTADTAIVRNGAAVVQLGGDVVAPGTYQLGVNNVLGGTSNTSAAAVDFRINGARGTGTGAGGNIVFQVAPAGASGSTQNSLMGAALIWGDDRSIWLATSVPLATNATGGYPFIPTMAGTPNGVPLHAALGAAPIVVDRTNHKLCFNDDGSGVWHCVP